MSLKIYSRERWGARPPARSMTPQGAPTEAFIHYSDTPNAEAINRFSEQAAAARAIQDFHIDGRGWSDIAYHYLVFQPRNPLRRARVFEGRAWNRVLAAQEGHNTGTLAICVVAGPGDKLRRNTRYAIEELLRKHKAVQTVGGHRDVTSTDCPGDEIYSWIGTIARASGKRRYS